MVTIFVSLSVLIFTLLSIVWKSNNWYNLFIKIVLLIAAVWGLIILWPTLINTAPPAGHIETSVLK